MKSISVLNRKGSISDSVLVPIYILVIAMTIFISYYVWTTFATNFTPIATNVILPDGRNLTAIQNEITTSIGYLDYMFPMMVVGLMLVSLIFAYKTGSSVIYAYLSIIMWILALLMSAVYTNIFEQFTSQFTDVSAVMTTVVFIFGNMKWIVLMWAVLLTIVLFVRNKEGGKDQPFSSDTAIFQN